MKRNKSRRGNMSRQGKEYHNITYNLIFIMIVTQKNARHRNRYFTQKVASKPNREKKL